MIHAFNNMKRVSALQVPMADVLQGFLLGRGSLLMVYSLCSVLFGLALGK